MWLGILSFAQGRFLGPKMVSPLNGLSIDKEWHSIVLIQRLDLFYRGDFALDNFRWINFVTLNLLHFSDRFEGEKTN